MSLLPGCGRFYGGQNVETISLTAENRVPAARLRSSRLFFFFFFSVRF